MNKKFKALVAKAKELGASDAKIIEVASIKTGAWTRWKCQFGCPNYGHKHCCPPNVPTYRETREFLKEYKHGLLVQFTYKLTAADLKNYAQRDVQIGNETLKVLLQLDALKLNEADGSILGLKEQLERVQSENDYLFTSDTPDPTLTLGGGNKSVTQMSSFEAAARRGAGLPVVEGK